MLRRGIPQFLRHGSDAFGFIGKQDGSGRHFGFCLFLLEGFAVAGQQEPLGLPGAVPESAGQFLQGQGAVFIEEIFFYDDGSQVGGIVPGRGRRDETRVFIVAHKVDQQLGEEQSGLVQVPDGAAFQFVEKLPHEAVDALGIRSEPERRGKKALHHRGAFLSQRGFPYLQINTVLLHGFFGHGCLGMLHMGAGDKKRIRHNVKKVPFDVNLPYPEGI